ncbi:MAG: replication protein DnaC [Thermomicrobiales bacterium]|jgi:DNA replication protein DnaC|nr:replication protein DnaC [Thermomicrobiales bacterium]MEA2524419.1 replication protein DnaC [Thermomicrobiales bacterium]MEA2586324.1 replication protein DnaC [Thermomicrobiales bacterium]MEA2598389.1 replication protein DnaC [Thermomicrobiales bacterium]
MDAPVGHPNFGRLFPCECTISRKEEQLAKELRQLSNLDSMADWTFDNFDPAIDGVEDAYQIARSYAKHLQGWLYIEGPCGVGKTHLAVAIAHEVLKRTGLSVYFSVVPDLLDQLRATFDPANGVAYDERFNSIRNCQLLILDDLGTENTTPWAREKLYQLVNYRYNEQLPTVVTTNQGFAGIDERILSRLLDKNLSRYVKIDAEDQREPAELRARTRFRR